MARRRCVANSAVGSQVAKRIDSNIAPAVVCDQLVSREVVANRLATRSGTDGCSGVHVRAGGAADRPPEPRQTVAAPAGLRGGCRVQHGAVEGQALAANSVAHGKIAAAAIRYRIHYFGPDDPASAVQGGA